MQGGNKFGWNGDAVSSTDPRQYIHWLEQHRMISIRIWLILSSPCNKKSHF
jgi:hypothetical protein